MFCGSITAFVIRRDVKQQTNKQRDACTCTQNSRDGNGVLRVILLIAVLSLEQFAVEKTERYMILKIYYLETFTYINCI